MTGYVLFRLGERTFATALDEVREIVRLAGLEVLPGTQRPLAGVLVLRGSPLPVLDVRPAEDDAEPHGDVLVLDVDGEPVGVAVDRVLAVLHPDELPEAEAAPSALPAYVVAVHRRDGVPVLCVDLHRLLDAMAAGWAQALPAPGRSNGAHDLPTAVLTS
jgi:chemotaxis signal transduction protein